MSEKNNNILLAWGNLLYEKYKLNQTELELLKHILDKKNLFIVKFTIKKIQFIYQQEIIDIFIL